MKNIILIAPPAGGKGTMSFMLKEKYGMAHISTGDILRNASLEDSERGRYIQGELALGRFVSDELVEELLKERLSMDDCHNGYILDGYPRNISQAERYSKMLVELGYDLGYVIVIDVDKEVASNRIVGRRSCPTCNKVYNVNSDTMMPKVDGICDICGVSLVHRSDDNKEVYEQRYNTYVEKTQPLIDYYTKLGVVKHINGNVNQNYSFNELEKVLEEEK